jgi:hypothetical protein
MPHLTTMFYFLNHKCGEFLGGENHFTLKKTWLRGCILHYLAESNTQSVVHVSTQTLVQINPLYGGFCQVRLASLGSAEVYLAESIV